MISMTPESILAFMQKNGYQADIQNDTQQVYTILNVDSKEYPLFIRVFDDGHLLQLLAFIPSQLQADERFSLGTAQTSLEQETSSPSIIADVARLLHLLNKELDVPGFGMDEMAGVVFYRVMLPTPKKKIDADLVLAFLKTVENVCQMFSAPIEAVSAGHATLNEILAKAQEMNDSPS